MIVCKILLFVGPGAARSEGQRVSGALSCQQKKTATKRGPQRERREERGCARCTAGDGAVIKSARGGAKISPLPRQESVQSVASSRSCFFHSMAAGHGPRSQLSRVCRLGTAQRYSALRGAVVPGVLHPSGPLFGRDALRTAPGATSMAQVNVLKYLFLLEFLQISL